MRVVGSVIGVLFLIQSGAFAQDQDVVRESVFNVSRVDMAYEPETREELSQIFEQLNASVKNRDLPIFTYLKGDRVDGMIFEITNVTNVDGQTSRATIFADFSRLLEVDRNLKRTLETRMALSARADVIREDLARASHAADNDLPYATGAAGAKLDSRQVERLQAELLKIEGQLAKFAEEPPMTIESVLIPMGFYGEGDARARLVAAVGLTQEIDEALFLNSLRAGFSYTVEWTEEEPVDKVWGNPEIGQNPDEKYFPEEFPRGVRVVRYRVEVVW